MRATPSLLLALAICACTTAVRTGTAPPPIAAVNIRITNNLGTAVNAYYVAAGADHLIGEVGPNTTRSFPLHAVSLGSSVTLRAVRVDGSSSYTRKEFRLDSNSAWTVP